MKVGLIHHTEDYHKLVEMTARECYQSYAKVNESSENFVKGIMGAGHISIASTGNIVFGVAGFSGLEEYVGIMSDLMTMKEINNFIRWTTPDGKKNPDSQIGIIVSMNLLTFLDIHNKINEYDTNTKLFDSFKRLIDRTELKWFINDAYKPEPKENQYIAKGEPELGKPVILTEDYTALKEKGLTDYELDVHATITLNLKVDRATGLQIWRHADMTGGTELSQRYVDRSNAEYREMVGFNDTDLKYPDKCDTGWEKNQFRRTMQDFYCNLNDQVKYYEEVKKDLVESGVRLSRAKEIARSLLPNAMTTKIINCRPLRQWKHFLNLRDTAHAQAEIREDAKSIKKAFEEVGIKYE